MIIPNNQVFKLVETGLTNKGYKKTWERKTDDKAFLIYEGDKHVNFLFKDGKKYAHHYCQLGDEIAIERFIAMENLEEADQSFYAEIITKMRTYKT